MPELFDHRLRALRRDRAARSGIETFLYDRAFADCMDRLSDVRGGFADALLIGCPDPAWPKRVEATNVSVVDPGPLMAGHAGGQCADPETLPFDGESFDLVITIGLLETANDLRLAAAALHLLLKPGGLLLGAVAGGNSLPGLRRATLAADAVTRQTSAHVHPRLEAPALARLLAESGFKEPVVDIDRVGLGYAALDDLVRDLRRMGMTNILTARSHRPFSKASLAAARVAFLNGKARAEEQVEILHFAAWKAGPKI